MAAEEYFRDTLRDVLEFRMRADQLTLDEADALFSAENCAAMSIIDVYEAEVEKEVEREVEVTGEDGSVTKQTVTEKVTETTHAHRGICVRRLHRACQPHQARGEGAPR